MGDYSLQLNFQNLSATAWSTELTFSSNISHLLAEACEKKEAQYGLNPVLSMKDPPSQVRPELKKRIIESLKQTSMLSQTVGSSNVEALSQAVADMKPSEQSGLSVKPLLDLAKNNLGFDPSLPKYLTIYVQPSLESAGLSFRMERKGIEMEFGIHIHAPAGQ